ncbi:hypothetical protein KIL84_004896 [Mauremys mutica]|uniref:Uncharacterized protein n=1 Tax=Mauremys mutica TaxID=74926 RepID=A0A9D4B7X0_9SAUR|nr:hypothetical protein KIL84_004505 [Mauremys mutica]KAH1183404.1 hypothetical protein KIL84_004896 [Mauremys mutica]
MILPHQDYGPLRCLGTQDPQAPLPNSPAPLCETWSIQTPGHLLASNKLPAPEKVTRGVCECEGRAHVLGVTGVGEELATCWEFMWGEEACTVRITGICEGMGF